MGAVVRLCIVCEFDNGEECYDPPNFSYLPYSSSSTPVLVSFDPKSNAKPAVPPVTSPSAPPPELMGKAPSPLPPPLKDLLPKPEWTRPTTPQWTGPSQVVMTRSPSPAMSIYPSFDLLPVIPDIPLVPWGTHRREHSSMEHYLEPPIAENPLEDPDSPMEDAPPLEPKPVTHYEPDTPGGHTKTLSPKESPIEPWKAYLTQPSSPVSHKHSRSPDSPESAPI